MVSLTLVLVLGILVNVLDLLCVLDMLLLFIYLFWTVSHCVCYANIEVSNLLRQEVYDESGNGDKERVSKNADLANVNKEVEEAK